MRPDSERASSLCSGTLVEVESRIESLLRGFRGPDCGTLLDVGCWDGASTAERARALEASRVLGVEIYEGPAAEASGRGIEVARADLETEPFPWPDGSVDVVVCNQVLEHLKNIWLPMAEMHRVLRPGGYAVLSVPNLASLHNRVLLALGRQPTSIRVFGPHIRGYAHREFCELVEARGAYAIERRTGAGFYPLPARWSAPLARLWPGACHTTIVLARKTGAQGPWRDYLSGEAGLELQTSYERASA